MKYTCWHSDKKFHRATRKPSKELTTYNSFLLTNCPLETVSTNKANNFLPSHNLGTSISVMREKKRKERQSMNEEKKDKLENIYK